MLRLKGAYDILMAARVVAGTVQLFRYKDHTLQVRIVKGRGQRVLQILSLNTSVDMVRVPKARTSGK